VSGEMRSDQMTKDGDTLTIYFEILLSRLEGKRKITRIVSKDGSS
jgi:hypothetical protein